MKPAHKATKANAVNVVPMAQLARMARHRIMNGLVRRCVLRSRMARGASWSTSRAKTVRKARKVHAGRLALVALALIRPACRWPLIRHCHPR